MSNPRLMIAAAASGSGKTMITCGLLAALKGRGLRVSAFKCGPDYIDPMFHTRILDTPSRNLDPYFTDPETTRYLFARGAGGSDLSILEGVMGYYDGLGGTDTRASAWDLANMTRTPVILVVNTRGMSLSAAALIRGFLDYRKPSRIGGIILNQMSPMLYPRIKEAIERELSIPVCGYVPKTEEMRLESRHLGLVLPDEVEGLRDRMKCLGTLLEETLDLDLIIKLAESAQDIPQEMPEGLAGLLKSPEVLECRRQAPVVAVARDEAFCFFYEDNLKLLEELGARLVYFSPLRDRELPKNAGGLILCGGYPELYADRLEANESMRESIRNALAGGMPCLAECGGFLYLHRKLEDMEGRKHRMVGFLPGEAFRTGKPGRFGYIFLEPRKEGMPGSGRGAVRGHEFHYFESTCCGEDYLAKKPVGGRSWNCIHGSDSSMMGFPHLYYYSNPGYALDFLQKCARKNPQHESETEGGENI